MRMTAVVIAGGKSRRMQTDKAFITIGGMPLIERVLRVITPLFSEVLINSNTPDAYAAWNIPVVTDIFPNKGALGGIYTALTHSTSEYTFCVACDMPLLNAEFIRFMQNSVQGYDALIPRTSAGFFPLHAIYAKRCCQVIPELLAHDRLKISNLFDLVHTRYVTPSHMHQFDPKLEFFTNLNTLEEVENLQKRLR